MVAVGALVAVQSQLNGDLAQRLGEGARAGVAAATVSFGVGLVVLAVVVAVLRGPRAGVVRLVAAVRSGELRPWLLLGGVAGALLVATQGLTVGTVGVALFTVAVVAGQTSSALVVDRAGLGPSGPRAVSRGRVVGAVVTVAAVVLTVSGRLTGPEGLGAAALALALLPLLAGAAVSWQQAVNGRVSEVAGPVATAVNNFAVGLVALLVLLAATVLLPGELRGPPGLADGWWLYCGGPLGVAFIALTAALVKVHGVLVLGLCVVAGQVVTSVALDAVTGAAEVGPATVAGAVVTLVGVGTGALASRRR
nr:DMT family transporter [Nocardioides perillae]